MHNRLVNDQLLTVREVARELRVSIFTVYRWMEHEEDPMPHIRIGRNIRIPRSEMRLWLNRRPGKHHLVAAEVA